MKWTILIERNAEFGTYGVTVPALPGVASVGDTFEEALELAREAIAITLQDMGARGESVERQDHLPMIAVVDVPCPETEGHVRRLDSVPQLLEQEITLAEAALRFGVSASALRRAIGAGRIPSRMVGNAHLVLSADVARYLASRPGGRQRTYRRRAAVSVAEA